MSLAINTTTPEGIILAADSRQSYRNQKGVSRIGSDSASKLFLIRIDFLFLKNCHTVGSSI
jgi:hypothetical protein